MRNESGKQLEMLSFEHAEIEETQEDYSQPTLYFSSWPQSLLISPQAKLLYYTALSPKPLNAAGAWYGEMQ